jgi:hypothetical protein
MVIYVSLANIYADANGQMGPGLYLKLGRLMVGQVLAVPVGGTCHDVGIKPGLRQ